MVHEGLQHGRRLERCCVDGGHNKLAQLLCTQLRHLQASSNVRDQQGRGCVAVRLLVTSPYACARLQGHCNWAEGSRSCLIRLYSLKSSTQPAQDLPGGPDQPTT